MEDTQIRILVIDDEEMLRHLIRDYLEDNDYTVMTAGDGEEGLDVFRQERPDAVFVDLNMPKVDGFQVLDVVNTEAPETPIVVISGIGVVGEAVRAVRKGAWDFITKPFEDLDILKYTLEKVMERALLIRENREYKEALEEKVRRRTFQLQEANEDLRQTQIQILRRLGRAGEYKDNETGRHVIRVSKYCEIIARTLGLPEEEVKLIGDCSPLHDIGKIGVPESILLKPGPLDDEEWVIMRKHTEYGYDILSPAENREACPLPVIPGVNIPEDRSAATRKLLKVAATIALSHHEWWNGKGYPHGLKGEETPIEARITALADVYDALGSERAYKKPFPEEKCQAIIREIRGTHLDPSVVDAFFESIEEVLQVKEQWKE